MNILFSMNELVKLKRTKTFPVKVPENAISMAVALQQKQIKERGNGDPYGTIFTIAIQEKFKREIG